MAIVGSGCSGIAALWALNTTEHEVYLYEAADRLGGHTNTVDWQHGKYTTRVDTGFIVMNTATYRKSYTTRRIQARQILSVHDQNKALTCNPSPRSKLHPLSREHRRRCCSHAHDLQRLS